MVLNEQLDENAADLREVQAPPPQATTTPVVSVGTANRSVSAKAAILAVGLTLALIAAIYFFLQNRAAPAAPIPAYMQQPPAGAAK